MAPSVELHYPDGPPLSARARPVQVMGGVPDTLLDDLRRLGVGVQRGVGAQDETALALVGLEAAAPAWEILEKAVVRREGVVVFRGDVGVEGVREAFRWGAAEVLLAGDRDAAERVAERCASPRGTGAPASTGVPGPEQDLKTEVEAFENGMIRQALAATGGNRNQAAQLLGIKRTTLVEKLKKRNLA